MTISSHSRIFHSVPRIITAGFTSAIPKNAPGEIIYIPAGSSKINATVNGKPGEITVNVPAEKGAAIAATLQAALAKRLESTVRPRLAFDHAKIGPASGHPASFSFDPERGIILAANWSTSGRAAIEGGDYGYFSPTFLVDKDGHPSGLPDKGEIGSLVDEPAFRTIGLIAAADSENEPKPKNTMSLILAHLGIDSAVEGAEKAAVVKIQAAEAELASVKAENAKLIEAAAAATKARHISLVEAAVTEGKIAPKDEELKASVLEVLAANESLGVKTLELLPAKFAGLDTPIVRAADGKPLNTQSRVEAAQAKARGELGANAGFQEVWARAAEIDPAAFEG